MALWFTGTLYRVEPLQKSPSKLLKKVNYLTSYLTLVVNKQ